MLPSDTFRDHSQTTLFLSFIDNPQPPIPAIPAIRSTCVSLGCDIVIFPSQDPLDHTRRSYATLRSALIAQSARIDFGTTTRRHTLVLRYGFGGCIGEALVDCSGQSATKRLTGALETLLA